MAITEHTEVVGVGPRIDREGFAKILSDHASPAAGEAKAGWDIVAAQGVDPLFALAVFRQESKYGKLGVCADFATRSPGNTRTSRTGVGVQVQTPHGPFIRYPSWIEGWRDMAFRLVDPTFVYHQEGRRTIRKVIERFAPPEDGNPTEAYIADVVEMLNAIATGEPEMPIVFGRVPHPDFQNNLIKDQFNLAWNDLGQRAVKGIVYHRQLGSNQGTENYFSAVPPGGLAACPPPGTQFDFGGCNGLTDYGVSHVDGEIRRWNDPTGAAHPGVSANRAGWASGPVSATGAYGDGLAFLLDNGWVPNGGPNQAALRVVNRDQVSIEISGGFHDPISSASKDAIAALSAFWADQFQIPWDVYPQVPGKNYNFTRWHEEFRGHTDGPPPSCPGPVVIDETTDIIDRTIAIMKRFQTAGGAVPDFVPFTTIRVFHVPANAIATARQAPRLTAAIVQEFGPGAAIESDGFFHGDVVAMENRWIRTRGPQPLAIHKSGVIEPI